jgi:hypothetical protein
MAAAQLWLDSVRTAHPMDMEWALLQSNAEARRQARVAGRTTVARDSSARPAVDTGGSSASGDASAAPDTVRRDSAVAPEPSP